MVVWTSSSPSFPLSSSSPFSPLTSVSAVSDDDDLTRGEGMVGTGPMKRMVPRRIWGGSEGRIMARLESSIPSVFRVGINGRRGGGGRRGNDK